MVCWNHGKHWSVKWVVIFVSDVCCTSKNPMPVGDGVWSMCNTMQTGRYGAWLSTVAGHVGTKHVHHRWCVAYRCIQLLTFTGKCTELSRTNWITEKCVHTGCQRIRQMMTKLFHCMGLSCIHWTCYTGQSGQLWSWNIVDYTKPDTRKGMFIENLSTPSSKENGSIVISKDDHGDTVGWMLLWYT